ncbi:conserved exported protein of unknown function [Streptomyces ambofaciens ATCC 23877]|uniref:Uncharacterized protein SAMT0053 n=1 Tax=Streptomyces ambofaciens (strain ATCC 23877 / 3486 / DSM 40053 / JCM 4204 / NBRC 12836 / NRRL B-2516) TaxID=278992 RepID=Q1RR33_STRA7|nr:conserved exported protein of unknown function [Streptomyces ambofaciens ATCC 23877]AKZ60637.1 conserved exported protein of unknown function [Streptomyces ambofaciens ATCC 23877]CAI77982.1 unknown hypothetical protein [Streptomyces ambofaciens ATCC 23877]CAI78256.1 unknown hypothetical protein [Streptomyces ambofaciens ATCC 23877]CAJ87763.1 hypothetical protein SAMT0054 [Streptomyces ambofaciens ATCC 23877]
MRAKKLLVTSAVLVGTAVAGTVAVSVPAHATVASASAHDARAEALDGGPPGWGYVQTFTSPWICQGTGDEGIAEGRWTDFVCVWRSGGPGHQVWDLYVP